MLFNLCHESDLLPLLIVYLICLHAESDTGNHVHKTVGRNNALSKALVVLNYALVALGLYLFGVAIWVLQKQRDGGIASYSSRQGVFIKAPVWFGVCFLICALACVLSGYFFGVRHVAPSVVEGLELGGRRKALIFYQVSVAVIVIILSLVFLAAIHTLQKANHGGISPAVWQDMAKSQPAKICRYEVENKCAGGTENFCSNQTGGSIDEGCPGHYCINTCRVTTSKPQVNVPSCGACLASFSTSSELTRCKAAESKSDSVGHCLSRLKKDVQIFLNIIVSSAGVGIGVLVLTTLLGTLSPCIHACIS